MTKLEAALAWARRGFRVFPCLPDEPGKPLNDKRAKKPAWDSWTETATSDETTIRAWWTQDFNIGVLTDYMVVVDIDTKDGRPGIQSWMKLHGGFDTLTVRTPSGGLHLYYAGADVAINQGALGEGLDIRSHHGYVLAPGSTINGVAYSVEMERPIQLVPDAVVRLCKPPGHRAENHALMLVDQDTDAAVVAATRRIAETQGAIRGEQSEAAFKLACTVRDYGVSEFMCATLMDEWASRCSPPLDAEDLRGRVANAYLYAQNAGGTKHPLIMFQGVSVEPPPLPIETPHIINGYAFGNALDLDMLDARAHHYRRLTMVGEITTLLGAGGAGKSLFKLAIAVCNAHGIGAFGFESNSGIPAHSVVYDAEDSLQEMSLRLHAICRTFNLDFAQTSARITLISGRDHDRWRIVKGHRDGDTIEKDCLQAIMDISSREEVTLLALGPLNKLHTVEGNDNNRMTFVMEVLEQIAMRARVAILLDHHTSKPSGAGKRHGNSDTSQGARAVIDSSRAAFTLGGMDDDDCGRYGLTTQEAQMYMRLDDAKHNRWLGRGEPIWIQKVTQILPVRDGKSEAVGGLTLADMHVRTAWIRDRMAAVLIQDMLTKGSGSMPIMDAVRVLKSGHPVFEHMDSGTVKLRMQDYLREPIMTEEGRKLHAVQDSRGSWTIAFD